MKKHFMSFGKTTEETFKRRILGLPKSSLQEVLVFREAAARFTSRFKNNSLFPQEPSIFLVYVMAEAGRSR